MGGGEPQTVWSPLLPSGAMRREKVQKKKDEREADPALQSKVHLLSRVKGSQIERVTALPLGPVEIIFYIGGVIFRSMVKN